jgi:hypothetical protein
MPGGMGRGAHGLGIDGGVVSESSLAKIVPKWDEGWKDDWGRLSAAGCPDGSKVGVTWSA